MKCGDTLLIPAEGTGDEIPHLWIVVTEPDPLCVIVCPSSLRYGKDQTVLLRAGDHPFVRKDTCVLYAYSEIVDADYLREQVSAGRAKRHTPCSESILGLVQAGILASPFTPRKVQQFYRQRRTS